MNESKISFNQNKIMISKEKAFSCLNLELQESSKRIAYNTQLLFEKTFQKFLYVTNPVMKQSYIESIYDVVKYCNIGYAMSQIDELQIETNLLEHIFIGSQIAYNDMSSGDKKLNNKEKFIEKNSYEVIFYHHERWDGKGVPEQLSHDEIPLLARMCSICCLYEQLTSGENDITALTNENTYESIQNHSGELFDPNLVTVLSSCINEFVRKGDTWITYEQRKINEDLKKKNQIKINSFKEKYNYAREKSHPIEMLYQPIVDIRSNKISHYESLMRINDRYNGCIYPQVFIPIAEKTGQICKMTEIALCQILDTINLAKMHNIEFDRIALNISGRHITKKNFVPRIKKLIEQSGVSPEKLIFEITETMMATADKELLDTIKDLSDYGIKFAIDDFGVEYSTLSRIEKVKFDILKIDKSFIDNIVESQRAQAIVKSIISLAENLNVEIVAEGVESKEQEEVLKKMGCYLIQGFLYSKPLPLRKIIG